MSHPLLHFFSQVPLFAPLSADELTELLRAIQPAQISAGEFLFREGDAGDAAYVVQNGDLEVFLERRDSHIHLVDLGPNTVLGEIALLDGQPRTAHVRAKSDVSLFRIDRTEFDFLRRNLHPAAYKLIRQIATTVCERVRNSNELIHQVVSERDDIVRGKEPVSAEEPTAEVTQVKSKSMLRKWAFWRSK
jgi:CRP/FNR family transcriptional regulator, cyclic AMP receptor protein